MRLLLDTQVLLWWLKDDPKLVPPTRALIADSRNTILVSAASFWEISIKYRIGKIDKQGSAVLREVEALGFTIVPLAAEHFQRLEQLESKPGHNDPFDHLILVQATAEDAVLITSDRFPRSYGIRCL